MFDKLKQIKKIKEIQSSLKNERIEIKKEGTMIVINGNLELEELTIDPSLSKEEQERVLLSSFNEAIKKVQIIAAQKMSQIGGF